MTHKAGSSLASGYWGGSIRCRIIQDGTAEKEKALEQDKLIGAGRRVELWLPVKGGDAEGDNGAVDADSIDCTCDKNTRPASDFRCLSCHGVRRIPGYRKFMHALLWFASAETSTLSSVERDTTIKPNRLRLTRSALTGTIVTADKAFTNPKGLDWEFEVAAFRKTSSDVILVEFSTNSGATWTDITLINGPNKPTGTGLIRLRITLTRAALTTDSPDFEIARIRRRSPERMTKASKARSDLEAGQILILRTWITEATIRAQAMLRQTNFEGDQSWTVDLAFFDNALTPNTAQGLINDRDAGPHPFFQHVTGVTAGERFPIFQISHADNLLDVFTHQSFLERRAQTHELYSLVF